MKSNEILREAEYADIILALLSKPYYISSITKIVFFSFCIFHEREMRRYSNRKKDFNDVFFQNISIKLIANFSDIERILNVIDILVKTKKIKVNGDNITLLKEINHQAENVFLSKFKGELIDPIKEINKLDSVAVIEEVIRYV